MGIVQGLTEFLPISSSGHLAIFQHAFGARPSEHVLFDVLLHMGTLAAVSVYYRCEITRLIVSLPALPGELVRAKFRFDELSAESRAWSAILVATFVTGVFGITFKDLLESLFDRLPVIGGFLILTGILLTCTKGRSEGGNVGSPGQGGLFPGIGLWHAAVLGLAQGIAIAPGLSRSGTTIAVALLLGVSREPAIRFSFLMSIPAIFGASLLEARDISSTLAVAPALTGTLLAFFAGLLFLWTLVWIVRAGRFHYFAFYTIPVGVGVILFGLMR